MIERTNQFKRIFLQDRLTLSLLIIIITMLSAGCSRSSDWVQFRGEGGRGVSSSRISPPLGLRWRINLQAGDEIMRSFNPPVVIGNTIYFGSDDGNFYALDVESGHMRWVFRSGAEINSIPYADQHKVYFGSQDGRLYALFRETGEVAWTFQTQSQINSQVQRYGDYIIFVGDADAFYFLCPYTGMEQFRIDNPGWMKYTFSIYDSIIYMGTGPRVELIGPFDINQREFLWFMDYRDLDAIWYSVSAVRGDLMYFGTADLFANFTAQGFIRGMRLGFHAFNRHTGDLVWQQYRDAILDEKYLDDLWNFFWRFIDILDFMAPTIWRDLVIFTGGDNVARAFDANNGRLRWERKFETPISSAPTIAAGRVYFGLLGDEYHPPKLVCISARDGRLLWQMETEGAIMSAPVIAGRRVIFGTDRNVFYVLEQVF